MSDHGDFLSQVKLEDLEGEQRELADLIGLDAFKALVRNYSGLYIYIPKNDSVVRNIRNKAIRREFDGVNYKTLAKKYNLSEPTVRAIISGGPGTQIDGQQKLNV